jgi:hypothetical protein
MEMAMKKSGTGSGGGFGSRNVKEVPVRVAQKPTGVNPGAVAQFGSAIGNHSTEQGRNLSYKGEPYREKTPIGVPLGNAVALNIGKGGVGTGRTLYGQSGSQRQYGPAAPGNPPKAGELFPGWPAKR